ncbi:hypothetical protein BYT27DRAFT_7250136 [Phlegmacium glaucopus]|nr:hypothetical protein BYT27DRAFT_7250136 [Phlegmacium glaucopus]
MEDPLTATAAASGPSSDLLTHPHLQPLGLSIHPMLRVLICSSCQCALLPKGVGRHFSEKHKGIGVHVNEEQIAAVASQWNLADEMPVVRGPVVQITGLPLLEGCIKCPTCSGVFSRATMPSHHSSKHAGTPTPNFGAFPPVHAQQLNKGQHKTLFEVIVPSTLSEPAVSNAIIEHLRTSCDNLVPQYFPSTLDARALSPWMQFTGWHSHIQPFDTPDLIALVAPLRKDEPALHRLAAAITAIYDMGYDFIDKTNIIVLQKLKSDDLDEKVINQPFRKLQQQSTRDQYEAVLVKLLAMLLRPSDNYQFDLPHKIQAACEKLQQALIAEPEDPRQVRISAGDLLFRIWGRTWKKSDINTIGDPSVCFLALSMLKQDGSFQNPKNTTPLIARLKYGLRLVMLSAIKHYAQNKELDDIAACQKYEQWFKEKQDSTFNTLCTFQHYASSLAYNEPGVPNVVWMDRTNYRTMRFKGHKIEFDKLTTLCSNLEDSAIAIWEKDVLMGLPLQVNYSQITDDMGNSSVGYSFVSDIRNKCFKDRDILAKAILDDLTLSKRFLTGMVDNQGLPIWKVTELQKWLFSYSRFHAVQITSADVKGGSPSRGTEIECIEYMNTPTRVRGLYMMGNHLAILCQYHKSASITARDKVIPHSLDAVTSDLIIQDLAIARPFAELAAYICYPHNLDVQHRYHSYLFINNKKLFDTPQLTQVLKSYTLSVYQVGFGVADWRHISAAFRRKICPAMETIVEDDMSQESVQALQSGHSRHTENHLYGLSPEALGGAPEDVLPLFLDASTDWQVACRIVPGGHLLRYHEATASHFASLAAGKKIKANYTTPVGTIEQVMDRVTLTLDVQLEKYIKKLMDHMDKKLEEVVETRFASMLETKLNHALDQITHLATSKEPQLHPHFLGMADIAAIFSNSLNIA